MKRLRHDEAWEAYIVATVGLAILDAGRTCVVREPYEKWHYSATLSDPASTFTFLWDYRDYSVLVIPGELETHRTVTVRVGRADQRRYRFSEALRMGLHALSGEALSITEVGRPTPELVLRARAHGEVRRWRYSDSGLVLVHGPAASVQEVLKNEGESASPVLVRRTSDGLDLTQYLVLRSSA